MNNERVRVDAANPWPGLESYGEAGSAFFKGREEEAEALLRLVERETVAVLYGRAGLGKTSLVQAGLFPLLRQADYLPIRIHLVLDEDAQPLRQQVCDAIVRECVEHKVDGPSFDCDSSLWESFYGKGRDFWSADDRLLTPILVFDQFEEVFSFSSASPEREERCTALLTEIGELVENRRPPALRKRLEDDPDLAESFDPQRVPPKVLLSFREDYLADFDSLENYLPARTSNRLRLLPMDGDRAKKVILSSGPELVDPEVAEQIVRSIDPRERPLRQLVIEPVLLSLVCRKLNEQRRGTEKISANGLKARVEAILRQFYEDAFAGLDPRIREFIESEVLTGSGSQGSFTLANALAAPGVNEESLRRLTDRRLLRREEHGGQVRLELTHEVLLLIAIHASRTAQPARYSGPIFAIPFSRNPYFTGREDVLARLAEQLKAGGRAALGQMAAISGLGGIGKTQTAVEFAYRHRQDYRAVFFIVSETAADLVGGFAAMAERLSLPEAVSQDQGVAAQAALRWLAGNEAWLLIFDNADDPSLLEPYLPALCRGHVLITSRAQNFADLNLDSERLAPPPTEEARDFLLRRTRRQNVGEAEREAATHLASELGNLPLALEQAAAYLSTRQVSFADYLDSYRRRGLELIGQIGPQAGTRHNPVGFTWSLNLEQVRRESPASTDLLQAAAFLAPEAIPDEFFLDGGSEISARLGEALASGDSLAVAELAAPLLRYSLVERDAEKRTLSVHRLVQKAVKMDLGEARNEKVLRVTKALYRSFPPPEFKTWPRCERLLPHLLAIATVAEVGEELARLLQAGAVYLRDRARFAEAEPLAERSLSILEKSLGGDHPDVAASLNNLANLYKDQGRLAEAEPLYEQSLAIREGSLGDDHPQVAGSLNNLANLYRNQGRLAEAEPLYKRSLAALEKSLGADHPDVATALNNLAILYRNQGRLAEAEPLYKRSLAISEKSLGVDHPHVAESLNNLADLYEDQGRVAEAEPLYERSLAIREKSLGPDHPNLASALNNLAVVYWHQGRLTEAEPLYERSLAISEKSLGGDHPDVATSLNNLANLYKDQGRLVEAEPLYEHSLAIREKSLGDDHPQVAGLLNNLANLYRNQDRLAEAEPLYKRSLAALEKSLGADHPNVATALNNLAILYWHQGRLREAEPLAQRSLAILEKSLGGDHPDVAASLNNLANLYKDQGRLAEAEPLYEQSLAIREKSFGDDHPQVAGSLNNLANLYRNQGRLAEAEPLYKRSLAALEESLGADHPDVATALNNLAILYCHQGRLAEAEPLYERSLAISGKSLGGDHPDFAESLNNLADLYEAQGRLAEAEPLYGRSLAIREKSLGGDHPDVAASLNNLAILYWRQGRFAEAEPLYERSIAIQERSLGGDHPHVAESLNNLAILRRQQGRDQEAEELEARAREVRARHEARNRRP
jgi:Tfp pilus assembly protein PilF